MSSGKFIGVQIQGLSKLATALKQTGERDLSLALAAANKQLAEAVLERARPDVPVRSGALLESLKPQAGPRSATVRAGSKAVPYAAAIHWGWPRRNIAARPFLFDAARNIDKDAELKYQAAVFELMQRVVNG